MIGLGIGTRIGPRRRGAPPRGSGHYAADGRSWWDDERGRWFRITGAVDTLEIALEYVGARNWFVNLLSTLGTQSGVAYRRFVGRARSADPRWRTYTIAGGTFPAVPGFLADVPPREEWAPGMQERFEELCLRLEAEGWRRVGRRVEPWSYLFERPCVDFENPLTVAPTARSM
jgi:hypothetical protein